MRKVLPVFALFAVTAAPAVAQNAAVPQQPAAEKQKTVTKVVCERRSVEEETGSRLRAAPKVCKKVQVPVGAADSKPQHDQSQSAQ